MCASAFTSRGYYSRVTLILFKNFRLCGHYSRGATIQGQPLFEGSHYSRGGTIRGGALFEGGHYSRAATIQGQRLFEEIQWLLKGGGPLRIYNRIPPSLFIGGPGNNVVSWMIDFHIQYTNPVPSQTLAQ